MAGAALLARVDHLVYGTQNLEASIDELERTLGVRAVMGGSHPGRGTRNALLALGPRSYLELLGPDFEQPEPPGGRWLGVDGVTSPRLTTWAVKATNLEQLVAKAHQHGIALGPVRQGMRTRADGVQLSWQLTDGQQLVADGLVPFFIDWGASQHPAESAPVGVTVSDLHAVHPQPEAVRAMLRALELELAVAHGPTAALIATLRTPKGVVELR